MTSKLYVDDVRGAPDSTWLVARTVTEAIRYIARIDFDEISLDHDISHYEFPLSEDAANQPVTMCAETFQPVAHYIAARYSILVEYTDGKKERMINDKHPKITIHTANPRGAKEIADILKDAGIPSVYKPAMRNV